METVFLLRHVRKDDEFSEDTKLIGIYSSHENAAAAIERLAHQPGFREHLEGFKIERHKLDKDHWTEGFVTMTRVNMPLDNEPEESWSMVAVRDLYNGTFEVRGPMPDNEKWRFPPGSIIKCTTETEDGEDFVVASSLA